MRNILFILADCLRADAVFGAARRAPTPTLDALGLRGASFTQIISSATMTTPCVSSFFTGVYPTITGVRALRGDVLNPNLPTLAGLLQERGYRTHALVTGPLWEGVGLERGFQQYQYRKPSPYLAASWRDQIREILEATDTRPWFIYAHFFDIHVPRVVAPEFNERPAGLTLYERAVASFDRRLGEILQRVDWDKTVVIVHADHGELYPRTLSQETREKIWQDYVLGQRPWLMRLGVKRDPLVRTWTKLKRLTKMGHGFNLSEGLVRVPLLIAGAEVLRRGLVVTAQARQVDLMPTILELAGILRPQCLSGRSLLPLARGEEVNLRPAYIEAATFGRDPNFFMRALRTPQWKYVDSPTDKRVRPQLYALESDPLEQRNVLHLNPDVVAQMQALLDHETAIPAPASSSEVWSPEESTMIEERLRNLGYF